MSTSTHESATSEAAEGLLTFRWLGPDHKKLFSFCSLLLLFPPHHFLFSCRRKAKLDRSTTLRTAAPFAFGKTKNKWSDRPLFLRARFTWLPAPAVPLPTKHYRYVVQLQVLHRTGAGGRTWDVLTMGLRIVRVPGSCNGVCHADSLRCS